MSGGDGLSTCLFCANRLTSPEQKSAGYCSAECATADDADDDDDFDLPIEPISEYDEEGAAEQRRPLHDDI